MTEQDESGKPALNADNPEPDEGEKGDRGLGTEAGVSEGGSDILESMPASRGEVEYPDTEEPDEQRPDVVPQEGHVEEDPDAATDDAAPGAKD